MHPVQIEFLDHVAIRVRDMQVSQTWYEQTLGLEKLTFPEWGTYPVFMTCGNFGIALFPANLEDPVMPDSRNIKIDHFAFRVLPSAFEKAKLFFQENEIEFHYQDHHYFESLYLRDPDGHVVELTTPTKKLNDQ